MKLPVSISAFIAVVLMLIVLKLVDVLVKTFGTPPGYRGGGFNGSVRSVPSASRNSIIPTPTAVEDFALPSIPVSAVHSNVSESEVSTITPLDLTARASYSTDVPTNASRGHIMCMSVCMELFPEVTILHNYRHPSIINPDTGRALEFDLFCPDHHFGIEYQGSHHYFENGRAPGTTVPQQARDHTKAVAAQQRGVRLITVPFTYDIGQIRKILIAAVGDLRGQPYVCQYPPTVRIGADGQQHRAANVAAVSVLFKRDQ